MLHKRAIPKELEQLVAIARQYKEKSLDFDDFLAGIEGCYLPKTGFMISAEKGASGRLDLSKLIMNLNKADFKDLKSFWDSISLDFRCCLTCAHFTDYEGRKEFAEWVKKEKIPIRIEKLDIEPGYAGYCDTFRPRQRLYMTEEAAENEGLAQQGKCYRRGHYKYLRLIGRVKRRIEI